MPAPKDDPLKDVSITIDDFRNCGWKEIIQDENGESYAAMWQAFSGFVKEAIDSKKLAIAKILNLFSCACSMMLQVSKLTNEPFQPMIRMDNGKRSTLSEDFSTSDIKFFADIVEEIDDPIFCARIADILWLQLKPKNQKYALLAIDNYCKAPFSREAWSKELGACWDRAIQLCLTIKKGADDRLDKIEAKLFNSIIISSVEDKFLALKISELFLKHKLGSEKLAGIAEKLEQLAFAFKESNKPYESSLYFDGAEKFYKKAKDKDRQAKIVIEIVKGLVERAKLRQHSKPPDNISAAIFYGDAIQKCRSIPSELREKYDVNNRMEILRSELELAQEKSLGQFNVIATPPIDAGEAVQYAQNSVEGKDPIHALLSFVEALPAVNFRKIAKASKKRLRESPLISLCDTRRISRHGKLVAKSSGTWDMNDKEKLWMQMVDHYMLEVGINVNTYILIALDVIRCEHRFNERDFYSIVRRSALFPEDSEKLVGKALFAGYADDFTTAIHILVPQVENFVRYQLKLYGQKTTHMDENDIENEKGLSKLMRYPVIKEIFGADLAFEIDVLFCHPCGPNLRNKLAHGLLNYEESQDSCTIYVWWFIFRLAMRSFFMVHQQANKDKEQE